jgi:hypothetical protein
VTQNVDLPSPSAEGRELDARCRELDLTHHDLWLAYFALGGNATFDQIGSYLHGRATLPAREHNMLALALNEMFLDRGANHPVPYL